MSKKPKSKTVAAIDKLDNILYRIETFGDDHPLFCGLVLVGCVLFIAHC